MKELQYILYSIEEIWPSRYLLHPVKFFILYFKDKSGEISSTALLDSLKDLHLQIMNDVNTITVYNSDKVERNLRRNQ